MRTRKHHHGFSLIEVLISLLIIMVGLLGVSSAITYAFMANRGGIHARVASEAAQAYIEQTYRTTFSNLSTGSNFPATFTPSGLPNGQGSIAIAGYPNANSTTAKKLTVTVTWRGGPADNGNVSLSVVRTTE